MKTNCSQKQLLNRIDQVSFAVNDMILYLDTHPCDEKALTYCRELVQERKKLLKEYADAYGPLIIDITDQTEESIWKRKECADNICGIMKKGFNIQLISHSPMQRSHSIS